MSKPTHPGKQSDRAADELFDTDMLSDSDDDFLAELDQVLGADSVPASSKPTPPPPSAGPPDFSSLKRKIDALPDHADPDAATRLDSDSLSTEGGSPIPNPTYGRRGQPPETPPPPKASQAPTAPKASTPPSETTADIKARDRPGPRTPPQRPHSQAASTQTAPPAPASSSPSIGLSLFLGLFGTTFGGAALWLTLQRPAPNPAQPPADHQGIDAQRHLTELDHRLEAVREQLEDRSDQAQREIERLRGQLDQLSQARPSTPASSDLETRVQAQMAEVHAHLSEVQDRLAALTQRPASPAATSPPVKARHNPAKQAQVRKGGWAVNLESFAKRSVAERELEKLKARGLNGALTQVRIKGRTWYRLYVPGFRNRREAKVALAKFKGTYGFASAWLGRAPKD